MVIVKKQQRPDQPNNTQDYLDNENVNNQEIGLAFDVGDLVMGFQRILHDFRVLAGVEHDPD